MPRSFSLLLPSRSLLLLAGLACVAALPRAAHADEAKPARLFEVESFKDVPYYEGDDADKVKHKLDLFLPKGQKNYPVLFFVHGGAWVHGDKSGFLGVYGKIGRFYAQRGVGVVVTNYRLSPGVRHPEHIKDVARAFAWTVKNIEKYGGDKDQLFVCGHSAGGHLVALLATDDTYLKAEKLTTKNIRGVVPISGVYVLPEGFLPPVFGKNETVRQQAAPINHACDGLPPFLILYADKDLQGCDKKPSEAFGKALSDKGTKATCTEIKDSNHIKIILDAGAPDTAVSRAVLEFIAAQCGK